MRDLSDCFKLIETPLPFAYMAHIRKLLVLWLLAVPWVLIAEGVGWITVAYAVFVVFALIGLERVAWQLEVSGGAMLCVLLRRASDRHCADKFVLGCPGVHGSQATSTHCLTRRIPLGWTLRTTSSSPASPWQCSTA